MIIWKTGFTLDFGIISLIPVWVYPEIFIEISKVTYQKLEIGKVFTQSVKIIRTLYPFKPKKGKGKTQKRVWSNDKKRESKCGENSRVRDG